jgi:hypothetical protein
MALNPRASIPRVPTRVLPGLAGAFRPSTPENAKTRGGASWVLASGDALSVFEKGKSIAHYTSLREVWASVPLDRQGKKELLWGIDLCPPIEYDA